MTAKVVTHGRYVIFQMAGGGNCPNCTSAFQGIQENHEYPSQFANYLGNHGLYKKSFEWENSI